VDDECYGHGIEAAELVLPCADLEPTLAFFTGRLGFRIASIFPAEAPRVAVIACHGLRLRLRVLYQDQGPPFVLQPGDAVLQPPRIRHRVLECSPGLEVIEVSCPAEHETLADLALELPTPEVRPERDFGGQRFVRHEAARATFEPWRLPGFEVRDLGITAATASLATAHVVRRMKATGASQQDPPSEAHHGELLFSFVLAGSARLHCAGAGAARLAAGDAFVIPPGHEHALRECTPDLELMQLTVDPLRA